MKKLLSIIVPTVLAPMLLTGCDQSSDGKSMSATPDVSNTQQAVDLTADQTVYQWDSALPASEEMFSIEKTSDEYWETVSGKQLKQGVMVYLTSDQNIVRVAPKVVVDSGANYQAMGIDLEELELTDSSAKKSYAVSQMASQEDMKLAGFEDGSVAIQAKTQGRNAILKSTQDLADDGLYLIHVKEKNSPVKLAIQSGFKKQVGESNLPMDLSFASQSANIKASDVSLKLYSPVDETVNVSFSNNAVQFDQDLQQVGAINGYYEIEATVLTEVDGKLVKRTTKVPFANVRQTASLGTASIAISGNQVVANIPVSAELPGRYAVKATLAVEENGELKPINTIEVAKEMDYSGSLALPFKSLINANGKYHLINIEVTDQTRMIKMYPKQRALPPMFAGKPGKPGVVPSGQPSLF